MILPADALNDEITGAPGHTAAGMNVGVGIRVGVEEGVIVASRGACVTIATVGVFDGSVDLGMSVNVGVSVGLGTAVDAGSNVDLAVSVVTDFGTAGVDEISFSPTLMNTGLESATAPLGLCALASSR